MKKLATILFGAILLCAPLTLRWTENGGVSVSVSEANARIGRQLTPMSVAGVHRRVHRRAYYGNYNYNYRNYNNYYAHRRYYHGRHYYR
jgi:hypothetical protein